MLKLNDFDYHLPQDLIAQFPARPRPSSRLLILNRKQKTLEHKRFYNLPDYINFEDAVVLNDTKVFPARFIGRIAKNNRQVELLLLRETETSIFECLAKPAKYIREKDQIFFGNGKLEVEVLAKNKFIKVKMLCKNRDDLKKKIQEIGQVPLPPYIKRQPVAEDKENYQTVYARCEGAVAAPTAGLHFTHQLLRKLKAKNVNVTYLTLHTGYGTFAPVRDDDFKQHEMHEEYFAISKECAGVVNRAKEREKKVFVVGTTTCRALESAAFSGEVRNVSGRTNLFIYPSYDFEIADALITNFHLPKTTLLMLTAAFCQEDALDSRSGLNFLMRAYKEAIGKKYRFYSYGDAMLII